MRTNIIEVSNRIRSKIKGLEPGGEQSDKMLREIAITMNAEVKTRIHEEGLKADGSAIGTYAVSTLKQRQSPKYNRTADTRIVLSLTRQMENDFTVLPSGDGYGLGFKNPHNFDKSQWNEERFGTIYALTNDEQKQVTTIATAFVKKLFN